MEDAFRFCDALGPEKIVYLSEPVTGLKGILVVDNVAAGPSIGGVRMAPDVTTDECFRLARAMTLKNAAAGLPHGGGKSVIFGDPAMPAAEKERLIRAFACAIGNVADYIPGPDMGTDETCMAWTKDEIGRAVGLPPELGGIPLDEVGATGYGLAVCAEVAHGVCGFDLEGARVVVQGFGSVGRHAARFLAEKGARLVAASDSRGAVFDAGGIDIVRLIDTKGSGGAVTDFPSGEKLGRGDVIDIECEIWIPAARPDVVHADNVDRLKTKLILQGVNIPITEDAEHRLHAKGILSVPDFIANAGGVICAAVEYGGGTQTSAFQTIAEKIAANTEQELKEAAERGTTPRQAAVAMAERRVRKAMQLRRHF